MYEKKYKKALNINNFINNNKKYIKNIDEFDINYNNIRHQFGGSECGVYSINFILRLLKGEEFNGIIKNITLDDEVNKCRKVYFQN